MFVKTLAPKNKLLLHKLSDVSWLKDFYLAGGTALALQYGHRQSIDLDWFTLKPIAIAPLLKRLATIAPIEVLNRATDTLEGIVADVKVSFMTYPYRLLIKPIRWEGVTLAAPLDIAIMKLGAIADRNTRKDFIDLYLFLKREPMALSLLITQAEKKFAPARYDRYHLCKSLTYFAEADAEAMPKMLLPLDWKTVRKFFIQEVKKLTR